jgi:hypothetical protein
MSRRPIDRSPDLRRLRDEGYDISVRAGYVIVRDVPCVTADGRTVRGVLVDAFNADGDAANPPRDHTMLWSGPEPRDRHGRPLGLFANSATALQVDQDLSTTHRFSAKPQVADADYYGKFTRYVRLIASHAQSLDPELTAATFPLVTADDEDSVFLYSDTASSRAHITAVNDKLRAQSVAIVGLGGTGSYVLDLIVKTHVREIHLFDGDHMHQHNAFRAPGAVPLGELQQKPTKVAYYETRYSRMRRGIVPHPIFIGAANVTELREMSFVFLALDRGSPKRDVVTFLQAADIPFVDVGMDVYEAAGALDGVLRVTTSTPSQRDHVWKKRRIPFSEGTPEDEYATNIQIVELNALNATLAVVKWKKLIGFYHDAEGEHHSLYTVDGNHLLNEDCHESCDDH